MYDYVTGSTRFESLQRTDGTASFEQQVMQSSQIAVSALPGALASVFSATRKSFLISEMSWRATVRTLEIRPSCVIAS
eukprot:scaffold25988_cov63-Phaeocystis_antarctica.AAC.4